MSVLMGQPAGAVKAKRSEDGFFYKTVILLQKNDYQRKKDKVYIPNTIEMARIKKPNTGQYKTKVQFSKEMSEEMVRQKLQETFTTFNLNGRVFCAAVCQDSITFQFYGTSCIWDGKAIKERIKGNSVLYIVMEDDQMSDSSDEVFPSADKYATSSGISGSDPEFSEDATDMSSLLQWLHNNLHFDINSNPNYSHLQGGGPIVFTFTPMLRPVVTSVWATFEWLGTIELERLKNGSWHGYFPASPEPAVIDVTLKSQNDILLGKTKVTYGVNLQQVVSCPSELQRFCENYHNVSRSLSGNPGTSGGETENSGNLGFNQFQGFTQQVQMLCLLVYVAAECGAQHFIKIIFTSSVGRIVFDGYKNNSTLPEVIAKDHGNKETANYLEDITKRFSEEVRTDKECTLTIDWSELANAAEAAQKQHADITGREEDYQTERDVSKETHGYLGDINTSSSESSEQQSSDSEDDNSRKGPMLPEDVGSEVKDVTDVNRQVEDVRPNLENMITKVTDLKTQVKNVWSDVKNLKTEVIDVKTQLKGVM